MSLQAHRQAQTIARSVHDQLCLKILPSDSERSIVHKATLLLEAHGVTETWYHNCPALVLLGSRSCLSVSGRYYKPSDELVGYENLVTVDLSPLWESVWGDCARSYFVEAGDCSFYPNTQEFTEGYLLQEMLHSKMKDFVTPDMTFDELYQFGNELVTRQGYLNLDFQKNLGHSIESRMSDRLFIEAGNHRRLGDVRFFTFEPHVCKVSGRWGFKHENIYYFDDDGKLMTL